MANRFSEALRMEPVIPPPGEYVRASFTLSKAVVADLERVQEQANKTRPKPDRLSRDRVAQLMLEWAVRQWDADAAKTKAKK